MFAVVNAIDSFTERVASVMRKLRARCLHLAGDLR